ncbi:MAG: hydrogenase formation protein HypD, partial [Acidobacteria bacterium]|nr:hydrogenase formation protein HypD [Acidobacteriota bacterium]
ICGGQTHTLLKSGLLDLLPPAITLVHGPGCPVCVTPLEQIDKALEIAARPEVIFCSFGDMLRVPGSAGSLFDVKAAGGDVRIVYSPLDAVKLARAHPSRQVVFFAIGFETTAPPNAMAVLQAAHAGLGNFSILVAHVLVPPAIEAILQSAGCRVQGFLAPGHVCAVTGYQDYERIAAAWRVPIVVTGFEPIDLLDGIRLLVEQLERGSAAVENQYSRVVRRDGNPAARSVVAEVFEVSPRKWRGIGEIPSSGLRLRPAYLGYDAEARFPLRTAEVAEPAACISGLVLQGIRKPAECSAFGSACTPERPLGAPMVSSEGACAAYYLYGRQQGLPLRLPAAAGLD